MQKLTIIPRFEGGSAAQRAEVLNKLKGVLTGLRCQSVSVSCRANGAYELVGENIHSYPRDPKPAPKDLTITVEGPTGSGKTLVMAAIVEMLHERDIDISAIGQTEYSEVCRLHGENIGRRVHDAKRARKPSVETVQAVKVEVDAKDAMAAIDTVDAALATLSLPNDNLHQKVVDAANAVLLGLLTPQLDSAAMLADLLDMANETLKWSHDVDAVNRAAAIKEKYKHG